MDLLSLLLTKEKKEELAELDCSIHLLYIIIVGIILQLLSLYELKFETLYSITGRQKTFIARPTCLQTSAALFALYALLGYYSLSEGNYERFRNLVLIAFTLIGLNRLLQESSDTDMN